jgi:hypothetical protein
MLAFTVLLIAFKKKVISSSRSGVLGTTKASCNR